MCVYGNAVVCVTFLESFQPTYNPQLKSGARCRFWDGRHRLKCLDVGESTRFHLCEITVLFFPPFWCCTLQQRDTVLQEHQGLICGQGGGGGGTGGKGTLHPHWFTACPPCEWGSGRQGQCQTSITQLLVNSYYGSCPSSSLPPSLCLTCLF